MTSFLARTSSGSPADLRHPLALATCAEGSTTASSSKTKQRVPARRALSHLKGAA